MIPQRYQAFGQPLDKSLPNQKGTALVMEDGRTFIVPSKTRARLGINEYTGERVMVIDMAVEVDPTTVEPVRVRPIQKTTSESGTIFIATQCPNCTNDIDSPKHKHCCSCGMALDWTPPEKTTSD